MSPQARRPGFTHAKVTLDEVGQGRCTHVRDRRAALFAPGVSGVETVFAHDSLDAFVVDAPTSAQFASEPRGTVGVVEVVVDGHDLVGQVGLVEFVLSRTGCVCLAPVVVTRGGDRSH